MKRKVWTMGLLIILMGLLCACGSKSISGESKTEEAVDLNYNFIMSMYPLDDINMPYTSTERFGDELNDYLEENGIYGQMIKIIDTEGNIYNLQINMETESGIAITCYYTVDDESFIFEM